VANNLARGTQILESGIVTGAATREPFLFLMTTDSVILTPTAQSGYFVLPVVEELGCVPFQVVRDTVAPAFGEAPATLPESRPSGSRDLVLGGGGTISGSPAERVVVPFPEPLLPDPAVATSFFVGFEWTLFIPANDQDDWNKAVDMSTSPFGVFIPRLWDAHVGSYVAAGGAHFDLSGRTDAITGARVDFRRNQNCTSPGLYPTNCGSGSGDPELTVPPPTPRQTFRVDWSAQLGDGWTSTIDPINVQDLAGNSTSPGASLRWTGNVVP
jgi:hypothetical protein